MSEESETMNEEEYASNREMIGWLFYKYEEMITIAILFILGTFFLVIGSFSFERNWGNSINILTSEEKSNLFSLSEIFIIIGFFFYGLLLYYLGKGFGRTFRFSCAFGRHRIIPLKENLTITDITNPYFVPLSTVMDGKILIDRYHMCVKCLSFFIAGKKRREDRDEFDEFFEQTNLEKKKYIKLNHRDLGYELRSISEIIESKNNQIETFKKPKDIPIKIDEEEFNLDQFEKTHTKR